MKIAVVIHSIYGGGAERVCVNLANAWARKGHRVSILTLVGAKPFYQLDAEVELLPLGVASASFGAAAAILSNAKRVVRLRQELSQVDPDVVLGMMEIGGILAILASVRKSWRVVVSERIYPPSHKIAKIWDLLRQLAYPRAHRVVMLTHEGLEWLNRKLPKANGVVIPNGLALPLPVNSPLVPPPVERLASHRMIVGVGRLTRQKGFDLLVRAFAQLSRTNGDWILAIVGEGPDEQPLRTLCAELNVSERVIFPGRVGNIGDWYKAADLFVMSSLYEGFPNALLEAMGHGCACVSFDCNTGPRDLIVDGQNGILITPVGDVVALARAMQKVIDSDSLRAELAGAAESVKDQFSFAATVEKWEKALG